MPVACHLCYKGIYLMKNSKKRWSIFYILLVRIFIVIILISGILAGMQISETIKLQRERDETERQNIRNGINFLLNNWNSVLESVDNEFDMIIRYSVKDLLNFQPGRDLLKVDLQARLKALELDPEYVDLNIIENGICVNSTSPADSGLDFYSFGEDYKDFLLKIPEKDTSPVKLITMENDTKRFRCYGYKATEDRKFIVEVACYSKKADELVEQFRLRLKKTTEENNKILSTNLHFCDGAIQWGLLNIPLKPAFQDSLIFNAATDKSHITKSYYDNDRTQIADYIYDDISDLHAFTNGSFVLSVISDNTEVKAALFRIIKKQLIIILLSLVVLSLVLFLITRKLRLTLKEFFKKTSMIADGALDERVTIRGRNEFTALAEEFNRMVEKLETSQNELKKKNKLIESKNKELQDQNDEILAQRDQIKIQRDEIATQKNILTVQKDQILEQSKDITDSIQYAQRIQTAILPHDEVIKYLLPKHFILYRPRNVVSGDFYWLTHKKGEIVIVVADCTGHGVPGALMSMLGSTLLNDAINSIDTLKADLILNELRDQVILRLRQTGQASETKDGMDIGICLLNKDTMKLQYAGAYNPLYMIRNGKLTEIKADRMPIGISSKAGKPFKNNEIKVKKDDTFYLFSDGIIDQFGGENGKKFLSTRFQELLLSIQDKIMYDQKEILDNELNEWMGLTGKYPKKYDQVDDIIVMGIKI
jgi:serine phosphatase RsbU (regulator of sigma subunit)